jgi:cytochrome c-type protein NapB
VNRTTARKLLHLFLMLVIGGAVAGFFVGTGQDVSPAWSREIPRGAEASAEAPAAMPYTEMDAIARGPNGAFVSDLANLVSHTPGLLDAVTNTLLDKAASLAERAEVRAFDGAPPVIPHPVPENDVRSCSACHGEGRIIRGRIAPRMSHQAYTSCTQCHAPVGNPGFGPEFPVENLFAGLSAPAQGPRAWEGAPPLIPHRTLMREDCLSCHGLAGRPGLRSTHPWRGNCQQCHAGSAEHDGFLFAVEGELGKVVFPPPRAP